MKSGCSWQKKYWVASMSLYLALILTRDIFYKYLIFNAVSFTDHTHYHSNKRNYYEILWANDRLCREHGLSVVVHGSDKGKSYIEH